MTSFRTARIAAIVLLATSFYGCSSVPRIINEYKIDVQQGNVLNQDMVSQLRPGLTRDQVRYILGTPMLTDMFHADRWDYVYRLQKGNGTVEMRKFSTFFDNEGRLSRVSGDVAAALASDSVTSQESRIREIDLGSIASDHVTPPPDEKGFFGRMLEKVGL